MSKSAAELVGVAEERGKAAGLPYAGALLPTEAYALLAANPQARLVDVRTRAEWEWVGRYPQSAFIEWNTWPGGGRNPNFLAQLREQLPDRDAPVLFICRSGARSHGAAATAAQAGYKHAFNVLEGFEGDKDAAGHRSSVGGWRFAGLPWIQG
jgi:rhodanese-related sulfurtransferase